MKMNKDPIQRVKDSLERLKRDTYKNAAPYTFGGSYAYVLGWTEGNRRIFWGPFHADTAESSREANSAASELADYEIFFKETRDRTRAWREVKSDLMSRGENPDEVLRRALHGRDVK
jgi:hypothetical protein